MTDINENINIIEKSYKDIYSFKEYVYNVMVPTYFPDHDTSDLNIGTIGLLSEMVGNTTEDVFNTQSTLLQEMFSNKAQMPESIYSHAAIFQLDNLMATPSSCSFGFILQSSSIKDYGELQRGYQNDTYKLIIDSRTQLLVEGLVFTLDYDIVIMMEHNTSLNRDVYSCSYIIDFPNNITKNKKPFIQYRLAADGNLVLFITCSQVQKSVKYENILNNSTLNYPKLYYQFEDLLAGFDVFYKKPGGEEWMQLKTLIANSPPIKQPFCYYKITDEDKFMIYFSSRVGYFQPEFNCEIKTVIYTTKGEKGNFDAYIGMDLQVIPNDEIYNENGEFPMVCKPISAAVGGKDSFGLTELQRITVEQYNTAKIISTENDLSQYFNNYPYRYGNEMFFVKKRDDMIERLFSSFCIYKKKDFIYPTNTVKIALTNQDITQHLNDKNMNFILEPGRMFLYVDGSKDTVRPFRVGDIVKPDDHVFINPFMMSITRTPEIVGYYFNIINQSCTLVVEGASSKAFLQFITNQMTIVRKISTDNYTIKTEILPSIDLDEEITDKFIVNPDNAIENDLRAICALTSLDGVDVGFIEMKPTKGDDGSVKFEIDVITNDIITRQGTFACTNLNKMGAITDYVYAAMYDAVVRIYILYKSDDPTIANKLSIYDSSLIGYNIINIYSTADSRATFIKPMSMMRSHTLIGEGWTDPDVAMPIVAYDVPMIKQSIIEDDELFGYFVNSLLTQYIYMENVLEVLKNNANLDIKFYNTYGKSKNFFIGDNQDELERVDLSTAFKIKFNSAADKNNMIEQVKLFIKEYIEKINNSVGGNDIYVSNLIKALENKFSDISYLKFGGFNKRSSDFQSIYNKSKDMTKMTRDERQHYVPELLVIDLDNIHILVY